MEYPIPTHLRDYLIPREEEENCEFQVTGTLRCSCGCREFSVTESNEGMLAHLYCKDCGKEIELFDAGKHGWNGFVCHMDPVDRSAQSWKAVCDECKNAYFYVTVWISSQGKEDFLSECAAHDPSFREEDWVEGFEWIQVSLECSKCGIDMDNWLDCECM